MSKNILLFPSLTSLLTTSTTSHVFAVVMFSLELAISRPIRSSACQRGSSVSKLGGQKQDSERDSLFTFSLFLSRRESDVWNEFGTEKWIKVVDKMSLSLFTDRVRLRGFENWRHHFWPPATTLRAGQRPTINSKANFWNDLTSQTA